MFRPVCGIPRQVHLPPGELRLVDPGQERDSEHGAGGGRGHLHTNLHLQHRGQRGNGARVPHSSLHQNRSGKGKYLKSR
jgi:hypothetical protein